MNTTFIPFLGCMRIDIDQDQPSPPDVAFSQSYMFQYAQQEKEQADAILDIFNTFVELINNEELH